MIYVLRGRGRKAGGRSDGDFFGEVALLSGQPRTADVVALDFCKLLTLSRRDFRELLRRYPGIRAPIDEIAKERGETNRQFKERPHGGIARTD